MYFSKRGRFGILYFSFPHLIGKTQVAGRINDKADGYHDHMSTHNP